ncbi:GLPGLI family protein [Spirosoma gilvum]
MKQGIFTLLVTGLTATTALSQTTAPTSGKITYEGMRQIDRSQMRMVINGQEVRPGSADAPEGLPETISFTQKLVFSGTMAKEERDRNQGGMMFRRQMGDGAPDGAGGAGGERPNRPRGDMRMNFPFEQQTYMDLANKQRIDVLTVKKDSVTTTYRTDKPLPAVTDWQASDKTKKIAGYVCHKATATHRKMPYTIWYTTDLPFTYSPVADLTPPQGVVLLIESDTESYKATGVAMESVPEASVQPPKDAKVVSAEEMEQIRRKGMADFRQRMMQNMPFQRNNN